MIKSSGKKFNDSKKYNGGKKLQLLLILPDEFNKRTEIKSPWNNYKHFIIPNSCTNLFPSL